METENDDSKESVWLDILGTVAKIPGVKVDRRTFLSEDFKMVCSDEELRNILENGVKSAGVSLLTLDTVSERVIKKHASLAIGASFLAGLPGGFAMLGTIPADAAQYYCNTLITAQKLAYVYGYPDLDDGTENNFNVMITILVGVMMGCETANEFLKQLSKNIGQIAAREVVKSVLMKPIVIPVFRQVAMFLGKMIPTKMVLGGTAKLIPLVGGVVSGGLTAAMFIPGANKLKNKLREGWDSEKDN